MVSPLTCLSVTFSTSFTIEVSLLTAFSKQWKHYACTCQSIIFTSSGYHDLVFYTSRNIFAQNSFSFDVLMYFKKWVGFSTLNKSITRNQAFIQHFFSLLYFLIVYILSSIYCKADSLFLNISYSIQLENVIVCVYLVLYNFITRVGSYIYQQSKQSHHQKDSVLLCIAFLSSYPPT